MNRRPCKAVGLGLGARDLFHTGAETWQVNGHNEVSLTIQCTLRYLAGDVHRPLSRGKRETPLMKVGSLQGYLPYWYKIRAANGTHTSVLHTHSPVSASLLNKAL